MCETDDYTTLPLPTKVKTTGFAGAATMRLMTDRTKFSHRFGCLVEGPLMPCIRLWTRTDQGADVHLEAALRAADSTLRTVISDQ